MSNQIQISAKNLGEIALPDFCPRCFWLKLRLKNKLPFQIFPGIFSSIDSYTKRVVYNIFDKFGESPSWLKDLGDVRGYIQSPHYSKFNILDRENNILLTGVPDCIFIRSDGAHVIVDYKTAKYTGTQDRLFPMYEAQLNAYAIIGNQCGFEPVSDLALIYMEPVTDMDAAADITNHRGDGFAMGFIANIHKVKLDPSIISPLLSKTREIYELNSAPSGYEDCKDCTLLDQLIDACSI